ncbi:hypothetical protein I0C86_30975 [Plantactinospora sp. S1510]|uniref:Uncharacterized protein n=1 Tax=Plantactinospora alkalitolerans TaxID=2789879 RepID=A0ABS0H4W4_9ACTN|nr:hypothetical protein [Plantactinospora alkalitolerans]MBF9133351.1 hypothetical protein [Plantactinospora alkalitolerans]
MSDTDKTKPLWVRATWYEPHHLCRQRAGTRWGRQYDCDLPSEPVRQRPDGRRRARPRCRWEPIWDRPGVRWWHTGRPQEWFIRERFTAPDRLRARLDCLRAIKEYQGSGEVAVIPPTTQQRHQARWLWD